MGKNKIKKAVFLDRDQSQPTNDIRNKAVFLDRDGVINKNIFYPSSNEWESPRVLEDFKFIDGVFSSLEKLQEKRFLLFIVTNQPSYAKGKTTLRDLKKILDFCEKEFAKNNIIITKTYCSFNHPSSIIPKLAMACKYRKPSPGALLEAAKDFDIDLTKSWMIGDRKTDVECGKNAGTKTIRIISENNSNSNADFIVANITEATKIILT